MKKGKLYHHLSQDKDCNNSVWLCLKDVSAEKFVDMTGKEKQETCDKSTLFVAGTKYCQRCQFSYGMCSQILTYLFWSSDKRKTKELNMI